MGTGGNLPGRGKGDGNSNGCVRGGGGQGWDGVIKGGGGLKWKTTGAGETATYTK